MQAARFLLLGMLILSSSALAEQKASSVSDEATLKALEDKWAAALLKGDADALAPILADTWVVTYIDGKVDNKAGELAALRAGTLKINSYRNDDVRVFLYGDGDRAGFDEGRGERKGHRSRDALDRCVCPAEWAVEGRRDPGDSDQVSTRLRFSLG